MNNFWLSIQPGDAREYMQPATMLQPGTPVYLVCRESELKVRSPARVADLWRKLDQAETALRQLAAERGCPVVGACKREWKGHNTYWLWDVAEAALAAGAVLLAETACRYVRNDMFWSGDQTWLPTKWDYERLRTATLGVPLYTACDPAATNERMRSYLTKRGQTATGNKGGRKQRKKNRRAELKPKALQLRNAHLSINAIAARLKVPRSTVYDWLSGFVAND